MTTPTPNSSRIVRDEVTVVDGHEVDDVDERDAFAWARSNQGFEGDFAAWLALDIAARMEYESRYWAAHGLPPQDSEPLITPTRRIDMNTEADKIAEKLIEELVEEMLESFGACIQIGEFIAAESDGNPADDETRLIWEVADHFGGESERARAVMTEHAKKVYQACMAGRSKEQTR